MHIIIAALTALGGIIWALYRLQNSGVDLNSFNPFYWMRRREWEKKLGVKPIHRLTNPLEAAAVLVVGAVNLDGVITREQKNETVDIFCSEFRITNKEATELFAASLYLLNDVSNISAEVKNILAPTIERFEDRHIDSLLNMLKKVSNIEGEETAEQQELMRSVKEQFAMMKKDQMPEW